MERRKNCDCGGEVGYAVTNGTTVLHCDNCDRNYPLTEPVRTLPKYVFDSADTTLLTHINSVDTCTPMDLCAVLPSLSYSAVIRRMYRLVKSGLVHAQKKHMYTWNYYPTELLHELAREKGW